MRHTHRDRKRERDRETDRKIEKESEKDVRDGKSQKGGELERETER